MDTTERNAVRAGDLVTVARCALRRGDRATCVGALAQRAVEELDTLGPVLLPCIGTVIGAESVVASRVKDLLCDVLPCPVGRWVKATDLSAPMRLPQLTAADRHAIAAVVARARAA